MLLLQLQKTNKFTIVHRNNNSYSKQTCESQSKMLSIIMQQLQKQNVQQEFLILVLGVIFNPLWIKNDVLVHSRSGRNNHQPHGLVKQI